MRKNVLAALACAVCLGLVACGGTPDTVPTPSDGVTQADPVSEGAVSEVSAAKTMGDIFSQELGDFISQADEKIYQCAFTRGNVAFLAKAEISKDIYDKLMGADDMSAVEHDVLGDVAVSSLEELGKIPSRAELDEIVGKTGGELVGLGYSLDSMFVDGDQTLVSARKDAFAYTIAFDGVVDDENAPDVVGAVHDMEAASASLAGISFDVFDAPSAS